MKQAWYVISGSLQKKILGEGVDLEESALDACCNALRGFKGEFGDVFYADLPGWRSGAAAMTKDGQIFGAQKVLKKAGHSLDTGGEPEGCG